MTKWHEISEAFCRNKKLTDHQSKLLHSEKGKVAVTERNLNV